MCTLCGLFQNEVGLSFMLCKRMVFPHAKPRRDLLDTHIAHTLAQGHGSSSVISVTAHCLYVTCMGTHFVLVFILESYLCIQSDYIPDNIFQKVTDNHNLFLTVSPNPH